MGLFRALPRFESLYMAPSPRLFRAAESEFYHIVYDRRDQPQAYDLLNYFRIRRAWDLKERVVSADVVFLRQAQTRYIGKVFDDLYQRWRQGVLEDRDVMRRVGALSEAQKGLIRAQLCGSSLKVFSDSRGSGAENCAESDFADDWGRLPVRFLLRFLNREERSGLVRIDWRRREEQPGRGKRMLRGLGVAPKRLSASQVREASGPMSISVIICTRNRADSLRQTLNSVFDPTNLQSPDWEVEVVDNNSDDHTAQVCRDYEATFPGHFRFLVDKKTW
jgi:hypothetical protein